MADGRPPSNVGCVIALIAFPFVVLVGILIGLLLRDDDDDPSETIETVAEGEIDGTAYRIDVQTDVEGASCIFLYEGSEQVNGACGYEPQDVTYGEQTVVFGLTEPAQDTALVELSDGEVVETATQEADAIDDRWYTEVVDGDVNAVALTG